jgi:hypothetical protein
MENTSAVVLPPQFEDLAPLVEKWALPTENQRSAVRWSASATDYETFYCEMMPRLSELLEVLSHDAPDKLPFELEMLYQLACAFAEAAPHHELYKGSAEVPHSFDPRRFRAMHGDERS